MTNDIEQKILLKEFEAMISKGNIPQNLDSKALDQLERLIHQVSEAQSLQAKGGSNDDIASLLSASHNGTNLAELEKGLAFYRFVIKNKAALSETISNGKKKLTKFRQSGHLIDQTLKYKETNRQPSLFDILDVETKDKIYDAKFEVKAEGIKLSASEDKLLKALSKLIYEENTSTLNSGDSISMDNNNFQICSYGGREQKASAPILTISPASLYKAYLDRNDYSGDDIKYINKVLYELSQKKFLIIYDRKRIENGKKVIDRIEEFQNLIKIMSYMKGLTETELKDLDAGNTNIREKKNELIIGLNPIFVDQINTKYIEYPSDINKRTTIAAGGHQCVTESIVILRDYMLREMSAGRYRAEINEEKLPLILHLDGYIKQRKKKLVSERILSAINAVKNLGIISEIQKTTGADGQQKYIFFLNKAFE